MVDTHDHRVLFPVDIFGGQSIPERIVETFTSVPVVLLGYRTIPNQTAPEQARSKFEQQARAELEERRAVFENAGADVSTTLAFTHDRFATFERAAIDHECDAIMILNPAPKLERVLVGIRSDVNIDHITALVAAVFRDTTIEITLFHVVTNDAKRSQGQRCLEAAATKLEDQGIESDQIETVIVDGRPTNQILTAAADHDMLVIGESRPSIRRRIFRDRAERIAKHTVDPVLVIRGEYLESN